MRKKDALNIQEIPRDLGALLGTVVKDLAPLSLKKLQKF